MALYRIGRINLDLKVIGEGLRGGSLPFPEPPSWGIPLPAERNLRAFRRAGWKFQRGTNLNWGAVQDFNGGGPLIPGLLALHPSGGLVILRDRLVLQFQPGIGAERITDRLQPYTSVRALEFGENLFEVELSFTDHDLEDHIRSELASLHKDPEVVFAEPSILYHIGAPEPPEDTLDGPYDKWHWKKIELLKAWEAGGEWGQGKGRHVAVIDEGFYAEDPQIKPNVGWKLSLDQEGHVVANNKVPDHYHGTMCAGLIGAAFDESEVNGVAPACTLGLVALDDFCVCSQVALGIALQMCAGLSSLTESVPQWQEADVISCSLGITGSNWELSDPLRMAIDRVVKEGRGGKGTPVVWATFNSDEKIKQWAVEGYEPLIVASQSNQDDERKASAWGNGLDLLAPGHLVPVILYDAAGKRRIKIWEGSSLAAPCVAGVVTLVLAVNPNLSREQVAEVVTSSCDPLRDPPIWNEKIGWGRLNARRALEKAKEMLGENGAKDELLTTPTQSPPPPQPPEPPVPPG